MEARTALHRCSFPTQRVLSCVNATHFAYRSCAANAPPLPLPHHACHNNFTCAPSTGSCVANEGIATHLLRSVAAQIVESVDTAEAATCDAAHPERDAAAGKMLCEVLHGVTRTQPTFVHSLGNTWLTASATGGGTFGSCTYANASGWRRCVGANIAKQTALIHAAAPHALLNAGLMEFLASSNLVNSTDFAARCCVKGSVGQWGANSTCVPRVRDACAQQYYIEWGKTFMDAGIRSFFFGQSRLTGGGRPCEADGTRCSRVAVEGVAGFAVVLRALKAYARDSDYGAVYFGPQAASGFELQNGTELADFSYGAQHLFSRNGFLVQPYNVRGMLPAKGSQWYGGSDWHDANRANQYHDLPVLLDFDNFSGDDTVEDDVRRLASWPNATRTQFVATLWHSLRLYNPSATLCIPLSKAAGGNWPAMTRPVQPQCWSGRWGSTDGLYFGAVSCGLVNATAALLADTAPPHPTVDQILAAVETQHFGTALTSAELTAVWGFRTLLGRDFQSLREYMNAVAALPEVVIGARGARCTFASTVLQSAEFQNSTCGHSNDCTASRLRQFLCLASSSSSLSGEGPLASRACVIASGALHVYEKSGASSSSSRRLRVEQTVAAMCDGADASAIFSNAALLDPAWKIAPPSGRLEL